MGKEDRHLKFEAVIGLEIHAQLLTNTKIFCGCSTSFGSEPNTQTCPVCIGMPGVLPVMNKKALEFVIKTGIAMNCTISTYSRFARKNYFYPDLPKGYQISQYELPVCENGFVEMLTNGNLRKIRLTRIHIEEDAGKNIHTDTARSREASDSQSSVDLNRAGVPLMEIVTEPDIRTPLEASEFIKKLRTILRYINVCDGNMEQGSLRCDANVSLRPSGSRNLGVKTEIKNMNSFKFIEKALEYEIKRQIRILEKGGEIIQETRLWDAGRGITESMRSKEQAHDYRYFPEPDLVPFEVDNDWLQKIKHSIVELPDPKKERFIRQYNLPEPDADFLVAERPVAEWFEDAVKLGGEPKAVSNWIMGELTRRLNEDNVQIDECGLRPEHLVDLITLINRSTISGKIAKTIFEEMYNKSKEITASGKIPEISAEAIVREKGLVQISDEADLEAIVNEVLDKNPKEVERFRKGEQKLMGFFVGLIMKETKGKANPKTANEMLMKKLR
jgi:aspartyl-tRNA(Asn)/glutamyl-tRNA(Gln) amidotransferase subunit B